MLFIYVGKCRYLQGAIYDEPKCICATWCTKLIVDSGSDMIAGKMTLENTETAEVVNVYGSATYVQSWFFVVSSGTYKVIHLDSNCSARYNGGQKLYEGATIVLSETGYLTFER